MNPRVRRAVSRLHFWLSLIVGVQVLIWLATGLFFAANPIAQVRGEHLRTETAAPVLDWSVMMVGPEMAAAAIGETASEMRLTTIAGRPTWVVSSADGPLGIVDAQTGAAHASLPEAIARGALTAAYAGEGDLVAMELVQEGPQEYGREGPVWVGRFSGPGDVRLYLDARTGDVRAVRTDRWRAFDLMWGLHIMDWQGRENFNHIFIVITAFLALVFAVSGACLSFDGLRRRRIWARNSSE